MKSRLAILVMLCIMSIHMLSIAETVEADGIDTHGFTIDVYAINMEQMASHTSYAVTERIYFNNTVFTANPISTKPPKTPAALLNLRPTALPKISPKTVMAAATTPMTKAG